MVTVYNAKRSDTSLEDRKTLHNILIIAYALTEVEVWGPNYVRISFDEYNELIERGEIFIAYYKDKVVGGIHFSERKKGLYSFSLLCADFDKNGLGIGRALINEVEAIAKENGATAIQIEILRPKGVEVPFKKRISDWYERLGYHYTHSQNFAEIKPVKAQNLVQPSDFDYYWKNI